MYVCHHCGTPTTNIHPKKDDLCKKCGYHLRVCANCQYYDGTRCILGLPYVLRSALHGNQCPRFVFRNTPEEEIEKMKKKKEEPILQDVNIKSIVVAIDGSKQTGQIISSAIHIAKTHSAKVYLVHAFSPVSELLGKERLEKAVAKSIEEAHEVIDQWAELMKEAGVKPEVEVIEGPPARAILSVAGTRSADMIIMGARGLNPLTELMLGSVSEQVVRRARCPVMIVR